jgi:hypothetical protein
MCIDIFNGPLQSGFCAFIIFLFVLSALNVDNIAGWRYSPQADSRYWFGSLQGSSQVKH